MAWDFQIDKLQHRLVSDNEMSLVAFGLPDFGPKEFKELKSRGPQTGAGEVKNIRETKGPVHVLWLAALLVVLLTIFLYRRISRAKLLG